MFTFPKSRPSAGLVVAVIALVMALGGTGYAASSISGKLIKKRSVPADRIANNVLTGTQIDESRLAAVPTATEADHAKTADDSKLLAGKPSDAFLSNAVRVRTAQAAPVPGPAGGVPSTVTVDCQPGEKGIGGGGGWFIPTFETPTALHAPITASIPRMDANGTITGWELDGRNLSGTDRFLRVYVMCVPKTA